MLRKILRKFQPNFQHYAKKIEAQAKKWFSYKKNVISVISNETTNKLTIYAKLCQKGHNTLPKRTSFFISIAEEIKSVQK